MVIKLKYSEEFIESTERLKELDDEVLDKRLREMSNDELCERLNFFVDQELGEENIHTTEEIDARVKKIMELADKKGNKKPQNIKKFRHSKRPIILAAAIVVLISLFAIAGSAAKNDFDIKNGIVSFFEDKLSVKLVDEEDADYMSVSDVELDLFNHGFEDIKFPSYFFEGEWKASKTEYYNNNAFNQVTVQLNKDDLLFTINIYSGDIDKNNTFDFSGVENATTIELDNFSINVYDHGNSWSQIVYNYNGYRYDISSHISYDVMKKIAENFH